MLEADFAPGQGAGVGNAPYRMGRAMSYVARRTYFGAGSYDAMLLPAAVITSFAMGEMMWFE